MKKRIISIVCVGAMLVTLIPIFALSTAAAGLTFNSASTMYKTEEALPDMSVSMEAIIQVPTSVTGRAGVIAGSYASSAVKGISLEIYSNGVPRFYFVHDTITSTSAFDIQFSTVDVRSDSTVHLAVSYDINASKAYCYLNGELKETKEVVIPHFVPSSVMCVGGDLRSGNGQYFKGTIHSLAVYSDARSETEVADAYQNGVNYLDEHLMCAYDFSVGSLNSRGYAWLCDYSLNKNNLAYTDGSASLSVPTDGLSFSYADLLAMTDSPALNDVKTVEAVINVPSIVSGRAGVIYGNYMGGDNDAISFEIDSNGSPKFFYRDGRENNNFYFD